MMPGLGHVVSLRQICMKNVHPTYSVSTDPLTSGEELGGSSFTLPARVGQKARGVRQRIGTRIVDLPRGKNQTIRATCVMTKARCARCIAISPIDRCSSTIKTRS
jgi:hypothetical protein